MEAECYHETHERHENRREFLNPERMGTMKKRVTLRHAADLLTQHNVSAFRAARVLAREPASPVTRVTETKLRAALDKIDHRLSRKTHGRPMSGLSIPAAYYFAGRKRTTAAIARGKKTARVVAGK